MAKTKTTEIQLEFLRQLKKSMSKPTYGDTGWFPGLCSVRNSTVLSLEKRGLIEMQGYADMTDGDGWTIRNDTPLWTITDLGRAVVDVAN